MASSSTDEDNFLDKLAPAPLKQFDAFPKLPSTYQSHSDSRGLLTILIGLLCFSLILNDIGEFIWGWPEYQFGMDREVGSFMKFNLDMVVNMPCRFLSVDLRDSTGDRLHLSQGFKRDGTNFDIAQAKKFQEYSSSLTSSQRDLVPKTRRTRGFFATLLRRRRTDFKPTYKHHTADTGCRVYGSVDIKKVTANLHITTLGHGYASPIHVDHKYMNLSHIIEEFSFGPYFPEIVQPLDNSFAVTDKHFTAYQYFLTVVPTKYIAARSGALRTHQYSVTNYVRHMEHGSGTPGIFFKFDLDPISLTIHEKTTTWVQFLVRCVGVVGGVWCCMGWAVKISFRAIEAVTGVREGEQEIVAVESTGVKRRWGGNELKRRVVKQGNGWIVEGSNEWGTGTPAYGTTPMSATFSQSLHTPAVTTPGFPSNIPLPPSAGPSSYFPSPGPQQTFGNAQASSPNSRPVSIGSSPSPAAFPSPNVNGAPNGGGEVGNGQAHHLRRDSRGSAGILSDADRAFKDK